jgi:hypothetical protein
MDMTPLPEPDPLPPAASARVPVADPAGRLLAAMLGAAEAAAEDREPELAETGGRGSP